MWSRFWVIFSLSFACLLLLLLGFGLGQLIAPDRSRYAAFRLSNYLPPLLIFGFVNTFFCTTVLSAVAWGSRSKMMTYVSGLLMYIFYMTMLVMSGSPLMAKGMPQSELSVLLSAIFDPFGLSGFFFQTTHWTVAQRNSQLLIPTGIFLYNRLGVALFSALMLWITFNKFSFENAKRTKSSTRQKPTSLPIKPLVWRAVPPQDGWRATWGQAISLVKIDLIYVVKSIPFALICLGFVFSLSMEMFGDIEKGIRLPQKYASSGLLASTIIDEFNTLCLVAVVFYIHDIFWRSRASHFHLIESATPVGKWTWTLSKWLTASTLVLIFILLTLLLGIIFQWGYQYPIFDFGAYMGIFVFVGLRQIATAGLLLAIQWLIPQRLAALVVAAGVIGVVATPFGNRLLNHPMLEFLMPFAGKYTDLNGFGPYLSYFAIRHTFAIGIAGLLLFFTLKIRGLNFNNKTWISIGVVTLCTIFLGFCLTTDYQSVTSEEVLLARAQYEKTYRKFQKIPQPTVKQVVVQVDLYPEQQAYQVEGTYVLKNLSQQKIDSVLVNFEEDFEVISAQWDGQQLGKVPYSVVVLAKPLLPLEYAQLRFKMRYRWQTVNGHESFNAIVQNGTFLRISRYFPQIGYQAGQEIEQKDERKKHQLGTATPLPVLEAPRKNLDDFISLDMTISTTPDQTAIGVGELKRQWQQGNRAYFQYFTPQPIPFRFGISSARYICQKEQYQGKSIEVYFHPTHRHNVQHLIDNVKVTLDYCQKNFGPYPFKTIRFAEVSGFTKGFAATAYPASIFMVEDMIFNANIHADRKQDVINELAGHELAHSWWGGNQIVPDEREGAAMLTESLAMYTELMVSKQIYGRQREEENVALFRRMYEEDRGFGIEPPLYKVRSDDVHVSYYKGLLAMHQLTQWIGEKKVNLALENFLQKHAYPNPKPISTDLLTEFYAVSPPTLHPKIDSLFKRVH